MTSMAVRICSLMDGQRGWCKWGGFKEKEGSRKGRLWREKEDVGKGKKRKEKKIDERFHDLRGSFLGGEQSMEVW